MKGGNSYSFKGVHLSLALVALFLFTTLLWLWEKNPMVITLQSAQDWYYLPSVPIDSIKAINLTKSKAKSSPIIETGPKVKIDIVKVDSPKRQYNAEVRSSRSEVCNFAKGRWIANKRRPLYSGFGCKQWLSPMWSCRLTRRPDFSFEGYHWQPENCDVPEFDPSGFFRKMQDKTIAFIGDSLGRQQFQSLMCMVTGGYESPEVENVGWEYGLVKARGAIRPDGWAYRFPQTNTTILYYWSASLCDLEPLSTTDPLTNVSMHLDRPPAFMRKFLHRFDVLVLNTGHHWNMGKLNANRWKMHVDGKPNEDKHLLDLGNAKNFTVYNVVRWLDSQLVSHPRLKVFFRTLSPRHFVNGDWNSGGSCDSTVPLRRGSEVVQEGSSDPTVEGALSGTKIKILDITAISQLREEAHMSRYTDRGVSNSSDCLHWCLPGIPDAWNELLVAQI
ncbi:protein trichome birefringence-like 14 isoform X2 [Cicer arietinum]|uniref:Protein trichome birefringence-like 14 isoform X2 n=1 Tax=Cicer arietinum TaxID=3827 RepID=A0A1S2YCU8_CICAR|nr:protein trichome birefringence-like 14 isoform X2 [Cicer arietinum]XP_004502955.1 protein trichome birefringence-like 14 isoform X2 [Cicer arietinum]